MPTLRFSPLAWAKLQYLRDRGPTEIGGFGVCRGRDLLYVDEIHLVRQECSPVTVRFDDSSVADFFDVQVDRGLSPEQFGRIWAHTHPGDSAAPSGTDETTFSRAFGRSNWAVMFILARGGQTYARLRFNVGPGGSILIPVEVDYRREFAGSDWAAWDQEYRDNVQEWSHVAVNNQGASVSYPESADAGLKLFGGRVDPEMEWLDAWREYTEDEYGVVWPDEIALEVNDFLEPALQRETF